MVPIIGGEATPMLSVILKTFLAALLITKVPYEYLRSEASIAPSLQTSPTVVAPGMKPSSLINRVECGDPSPFAIKVASNGTLPVRRRVSVCGYVVEGLSLRRSPDPPGHVRAVTADG